MQSTHPMSQQNNATNECSNANQDYGSLVKSFARLNPQQFTDTLAEAFVRANQNAAANKPIPSNLIQHQQQPQPTPTVLVSRLKAKLKRRARLADESASVNNVVDDELDGNDNRSGRDYNVA